MALPGIISKAVKGITSAKAAKETSQGGMDTVKNLAGGALTAFKFPIFIMLFGFFFFFVVAVMFITQVGDRSVQLVSPWGANAGSTGSSGTVNLDYDFEDYVAATDNSGESGNIPSVDLAGTEYGNVANFNQHIKESVNKAGYGTRSGVVVAGVSLIGDYIKATGKRLRYDQYSLGGRQGQDTEGIVNEDFYLDCSSFSWWALYNGGFKTPCYPQTGSIYSWATGAGYARDDMSVGQPGDYIVTRGSGHIMLIVGNYDGGYYIAEFNGWGIGSGINKYSYGSFSNHIVIDMTDYYNNPDNKR